MDEIITPKSGVLNYAILIMNHLKWAWDFILYQSFFQPGRVGLHELTQYKKKKKVESEECAVCLCRIEEEDDVRELRCDHMFHEVCLDRWIGYGHLTCPLCRNHLKPPLFTADLHHQLILLNLNLSDGGTNRQTWWLR